jgi:hypothetical protein
MIVLLLLGAAVIAFVGYRLRLRRCEKAVRLTSVQDRIARHAHVIGAGEPTTTQLAPDPAAQAGASATTVCDCPVPQVRANERHWRTTQLSLFSSAWPPRFRAAHSSAISGMTQMSLGDCTHFAVPQA